MLGRYPIVRLLGLLIACTTILVAVVQSQRGQPTTTSQERGRKWTPPRTPWGDPDLQGSFSNSNQYATPLERPDEFTGKSLSDLTAEDLARVREQATPQAIAGLAPGPRGPDYWWLENLDLRKRAQPWLIIDPPDGRIPPLTPEARRRGTRVRSSFIGGPFNGPEDLGLLERCISRGVPGSMIPVMYGNNYQFIQTPDYVAITYEIIHEARIIPLDRRPHVGQGIRQYMGDARGHWDGDTLVVETTNFNNPTAYRGANAATLRVIERFTRVAPDAIAWTATIEDPATWTRPWTIAMPLTEDLTSVLPFECHEGNYGLKNILSAARAAEKDR